MSLAPALRRHASLVVLSVLVAAAGVVAYVDRGAVTTDEARGRARSLCPFFRRDEVTEVRVERDGHVGRVYRGELTDAGQRPWRIDVGDQHEAAEEAAIDQLLGSLRDGVVVRRVASVEAKDREGFGLDAPAGRIDVTMGDRTVKLAFGSKHAPDGAAYVEVDGHEVAVITAQLAAALSVTPDDLRRRALLAWDPSEVSEMRLDGEGGKRDLETAPWPVARGSGWRIAGVGSTSGDRASASAVDAIWDAIGQLKADAFLTPAQAKPASSPVVKLSLRRRDGQSFDVALGGTCPGHPDDVVALEAGDRGACVPRGPLAALSTPAAELVDRKPVGARADEISEVILQQGATTLDLARSGSGWHERTPVDRPVEGEAGRALLDRILGVTATDIARTADEKALGLDPPRATVRVVSTLGEGRGERVEVIRVGAVDAAGLHLGRVEDGTFLTVPAEAEAALLPDELALRARKVLDLGTTEFRAVRVAGPLGRQALEQKGGRWQFVEPQAEGLVPDPGLVGELTDAIGKLSAERWVGAARPEQGLDHPRMTIAADVGSGATARTVEIALGAPVGAGSSFARLAGDPAVFVAPASLEAAAGRWMIDRTALLVDVEHLTRATLATRDKKVVLEQAGGALRIAGDAASAERAAKIRDALRELVADEAVSVGPPRKEQGLDEPTLRVNVEDGAAKLSLRFGAHGTEHGARVTFARREGVAATFAVGEARVQPLLDALR